LAVLGSADFEALALFSQPVSRKKEECFFQENLISLNLNNFILKKQSLKISLEKAPTVFSAPFDIILCLKSQLQHPFF
jgi:hypothetical protein